MSWWIWMIGGLLLLVIELVTPGSLFWIFFATGALAAGTALLIWPDMNSVVQGVLFLAISGASLALFRRPMLEWLERRSPKAGPVDPIVGEIAVTLSDIPPGEVGKAELRGTAWSATNFGAAAIPIASRCRVEKVEGLMLWIRGKS